MRFQALALGLGCTGIGMMIDGLLLHWVARVLCYDPSGPRCELKGC